MKDVLVLGLPTNAPEELATLFYNQIATYNEMREYDEEDENNRDDVCIFDHRFSLCALH